MSWDEVLAVVLLVVALFGALYLWSRIRPPRMSPDETNSRRAVLKQARENWLRRRSDPPS